MSTNRPEFLIYIWDRYYRDVLEPQGWVKDSVASQSVRHAVFTGALFTHGLLEACWQGVDPELPIAEVFAGMREEFAQYDLEVRARDAARHGEI